MLVAVFVWVLRHFPASSLAIVELVGTLPALLCMPFAGAITEPSRSFRRLHLVRGRWSRGTWRKQLSAGAA
jgi:hypothetical protein